jgi:hypothetical protein
MLIFENNLKKKINISKKILVDTTKELNEDEFHNFKKSIISVEKENFRKRFFKLD